MTNNARRTLTHGLWFNNQAEEAAKFYTSLFPDSSIGHIARYGKEGFEYHGQPEGAVMSVDFNVSGLGFTALNGGPKFTPNPSITFFVACYSKEEVDRLYIRLSENGNVLVPLRKYDWSERYGWVQDQNGWHGNSRFANRAMLQKKFLRV
jgi:predicted 3-demethylubiquinone-9 3-methyltransferase (glyoxalase superfamily)